jgi:hypothetical protein
VIARSLIPRLTDIIEAIERVNGVLDLIYFAYGIRHGRLCSSK